MLPCASSRHIRVRVMILAPSRICSHVGKMRNAYNTTLETDTPYTFLRSAMNRLFLVGLLFRTSLAITSRHDARYEHESISSGMASEHLFFKKLGIEHAYGLRPTEFLAVMESSAEPSARTGGLALLSASESHEASCQDAQPGSMCYHAASWLQAEGLAKYPDWYPSLSADSTRQEVQAVLHTLGKADCPSPCISRVAKRLAQSLDERALEVDGTGRQVFSEAYELSEPTSCGDVVEGDWCSLSIQWLKNIGLESHPDWYPGLTRQSSIHDFQTVLHNSGKVGCKLPCSSIPQVMSTTTSDITQAVVSPSAMKINAELEECEVPREGSRCYNAIRNVMQVGLGAHPEEYPELSESSSREEVQEHLFLRRQYECGRPCPKDLVSKHSRHQRVKMNVADMTEHEMTMYLNHEWDGYVDGDEYGASAADNAFEDGRLQRLWAWFTICVGWGLWGTTPPRRALPGRWRPLSRCSLAPQAQTCDALIFSTRGTSPEVPTLSPGAGFSSLGRSWTFLGPGEGPTRPKAAQDLPSCFFPHAIPSCGGADGEPHPSEPPRGVPGRRRGGRRRPREEGPPRRGGRLPRRAAAARGQRRGGGPGRCVPRCGRRRAVLPGGDLGPDGGHRPAPQLVPRPLPELHLPGVPGAPPQDQGDPLHAALPGLRRGLRCSGESRAAAGGGADRPRWAGSSAARSVAADEETQPENATEAASATAQEEVALQPQAETVQANSTDEAQDAAPAEGEVGSEPLPWVDWDAEDTPPPAGEPLPEAHDAQAVAPQPENATEEATPHEEPAMPRQAAGPGHLPLVDGDSVRVADATTEGRWRDFSSGASTSTH
ncbi:unnamed protein product [Prorocentrum cordatum]|uniref:Uncharacterized protein n=1 Tax=Prorocentrum cordatum TaxID=2364126 RepID=A0ABN9RI84_9DINO|nr:unnamed protein product [Polarella glacialis]